MTKLKLLDIEQLEKEFINDSVRDNALEEYLCYLLTCKAKGLTTHASFSQTAKLIKKYKPAFLNDVNHKLYTNAIIQNIGLNYVLEEGFTPFKESPIVLSTALKYHLKNTVPSLAVLSKSEIEKELLESVAICVKLLGENEVILQLEKFILSHKVQGHYLELDNIELINDIYMSHQKEEDKYLFRFLMLDANVSIYEKNKNNVIHTPPRAENKLCDSFIFESLVQPEVQFLSQHAPQYKNRIARIPTSDTRFAQYVNATFLKLKLEDNLVDKENTTVRRKM